MNDAAQLTFDLGQRPALGREDLLVVPGNRVAVAWIDRYPDWPGPDAFPADWALVATYVAQDQHGRGVGGRLFEATLAAARAAGVVAIDATIRRENVGGLAYYARMGFAEHRSDVERISKKLDLSGA